MFIMEKWKQLSWFLKHGQLIVFLFQIDASSWPTWRRNLLQILRSLVLSFVRFRESRADIQTGSLTFITLLSLVPILAFAFSITKTLGLHQSLQTEVIIPLLDKWVDPNKAPELRSAIEQMFAFVEHTDVSSLGVIGFVTLGYAVIRMLGAVELALNSLWEISTPRSFMRKISDYLSVVIIVPISLLLGVTTSQFLFSHTEDNSAWTVIGLQLFTVVILWMGFAFIYYFMPNTKVRHSSALRGGILGGTLWLLIHYTLIRLQIGVADYNAIYAGFSVLPVFMLWIYASWWAVLIGGTFAAGNQLREQYRKRILRSNMGIYAQEELALRIMICLAQQYTQPNGTKSMEDLSQELGEEEEVIHVVIDLLEQAHLVVYGHDARVVVAKNLDDICLFQIVEAMKLKDKTFTEAQQKQAQFFMMTETHTIDPITQIIQEYRDNIRKHAANKTLRQLVVAIQELSTTVVSESKPVGEVQEHTLEKN